MLKGTAQRFSARHSGFTLVELMIVVVVASILVAIAVPSYQYEVQKARRTDARNAILDIAAREERFLSVANS
jgi:type IV pilus assembly protein PilE